MTKIAWVLTLILICSGCGSSSPEPKRDCAAPTAEECLDSSYYNDCLGKTADFKAQCQEVLKDHSALETKSQALVPELNGFEETIRERKSVIHHGQPLLYLPGLVMPERYALRDLRNGLLNINDRLLNDDSHSTLFQDLDVDFQMSPDLFIQKRQAAKSSSKAASLPFTLSNDPEYMFDGLSYSDIDMSYMLDSLYVGKVTAWDENDLKVESCEEFVFEQFYDFTLFKDFATLHNDDPLRVVEYAYRGVTLDDEGIHYDNYNAIEDGAIGTKILRYGIYSPNVVMKKGISVWPDEDMRTPTIPSDLDKLVNSFHGLDLQYTYWPGGLSVTIVNFSNDLDSKTVRAHEFSNNYTDGECIYTDSGIECNGSFTQKNYIPKNFFLEVLGKINPSNINPASGIILTNDTLKAVYSQPDFNDAAVAETSGYTNDWEHHFIMLQAARRVQPNTILRKQKLLDFKLLRRHLIELLAERAFWERKLLPMIDFVNSNPTAKILTESETLGLSEKEYAQMKLDDLQAGGHVEYANDNGLQIMVDPVLISYQAMCVSLDRQIEDLLLEARGLGCLETDRNPALHNYPVIEGEDSGIYDLAYTGVMGDWTPELFSVSAQNLIPAEVLDKSYAKCQRVTAGDFNGMHPDSFTFDFPATGGCIEEPMFSLWNPGEERDYTQDSTQFRKFEDLVSFYPKALSDCDAIIAGKTEIELQNNDMNYYDPVTGNIMMSKSSSYYDKLGGEYAGLEFGYALGWLYEGYDTIPGIETNNIELRDFVCENTNFFAFGNYFVEGSFLKHDFVLCSAGAYASNKTSDGGRPTPPTLSNAENSDKINANIAAVAGDNGVTTNYFMFIKNEKMTYSYDQNSGLTGTPESFSHSQPYNGDELNYPNAPRQDAQMLTINMKQTVPICGIISITIKGALAGDIDADTNVLGDKAENFVENRCKSMNFSFTPHIDFDGYAQASVTAGISGVAGVSAGVDIGLKFVGLSFPYTTELFVSQFSSSNNEADRPFNYDIHSSTFSNLDQELKLLSGYFGAFVKVDYVIGSDTYRQSLFSWDGFNFNGNLDRVGTITEGERIPLKIPVRALYTLSQRQN